MDTRKVYVRFRGRTSGPFSEDEIKSMVDRGQISRLHALSTDRVHWQRAGNLSKLYTNAKPNGSNNDAISDALVPVEPPVQAEQPESIASWYYAIDGREVGPVKEHQVQRLIQRGALKGKDLVWTDGMKEWSPIAETTLSQHL